MHNSLRRNSTLLIASQAITAAVTFVFWVICARIFSAGTVGVATSLISFGTLIAAFTNLGLPNTVIRFLPRSKQQGGIFGAAVTALIVSSIIGVTIALLLVHRLAPKLSFVSHDLVLAALLLLLVMGNTLSVLMDGTLMAFRKGEYIFRKALITNLPRLVLPFLVAAYAVKGILSVYVILLLIGTTYNIFIVTRKLLSGSSFRPRGRELITHKSYALSNYFGGMFGILPSTLVPIIVLNKLGAAQAAFFYMPMQMAAFLNIISSSTSQSLMSESSQNDDVREQREHFKTAARQLYGMLIPAIMLLIVVGWIILWAYGHEYSRAGYPALVFLAISSIFVAINWLGDTLLNIQKRARAYFAMNCFNAIVVVAAVYVCSRHSLTMVGVGWLIGQTISAAVYLIIFARAELLGLVSSRTTSS